MSDCWFNLRIGYYHLQAKTGSLFVWSWGTNGWWYDRWKQKPVELYACDIKAGWQCRNDGVPQATTKEPRP